MRNQFILVRVPSPKATTFNDAGPRGSHAHLFLYICKIWVGPLFGSCVMALSRASVVVEEKGPAHYIVVPSIPLDSFIITNYEKDERNQNIKTPYTHCMRGKCHFPWSGGVIVVFPQKPL